ncbi:anaerobic ribonucleoside triphosphate reductase [Bacteroides thetaiotaomicron]|uniref:anaerobic ribonucleoside triphosphate reductase n=1 Tax=Bacteroides thetaiotaomicron TaxID=818 RepID=UPI0039C4CE9A
MKTVIKRDGRKVPFDHTLIIKAVLAAMKEVGTVDEDYAMKIANKIAAKCPNEISVEEIQNLVEESLMASKYKDVARAYICYRNERNKARHRESDQTILSIIAAEKNDITRENANMNADTPAGMVMKIASERSKELVDDYLLSEEAKKAVADNILHIHDKDYLPTRSLTCIQHPVDKILSGGFQAGHGESRPAKRIETASILSCISMESVQNVMHGGQAIPAFDFYMAPYVRVTFKEELKKLEAVNEIDLSEAYDAPYDDFLIKPLDGMKSWERMVQHAMNETVRRVHQSMEAFVHNLNTIHSRGGNQVVFSSVNYGTDTSAEGRCVIRELLLTTEKGIGNGSTAIFPIQIWKKKRGVSYLPGDPNYDLYKLACRVTAKRFFPNFVNLDAPFNQHGKWCADDPKRYMYEVATMGCRTRVFEDRHGEKTSVGRGNLSFSTINLPGIALSVRHIEDENERIIAFFDKLIDAMNITARQLLARYEFQCTAKAKQFPLLMQGLWIGSEALGPNDEVRSVLKHGTLGIGFIGLAECLVALIGKHHGENDAAQKLGLRIIGTMRNCTQAFSDYYDMNFSVLATPAEGLSGKFTKKDRQKYGIIPGVTDRDYYTNSNHVPVYYKCAASHKAQIEAPYHEMTRGGHIFYVELDGDATHNVEAVMNVVDLMDQFNIGYCSINHTRNRCLDCGYEDAQKKLITCPNCGSENIDTLQRITGYLVGTTDRWNSAKLAELKDRETHE